MQPRKPGSDPSPAPSAPAPATTTPATNPAAANVNKWRLPLIGAGAVLLVLLGGLTLWAVTGKEPPRLNADTVTLVKFATTREYARLPFDRQAEYMKVLEDRDDNDELDAALDAGTLTEAEYRTAILEAWLGQQLKRTEKFHSLSPGTPRDRYIRDLVDKKEKKEARKAAKQKPGKQDASPGIKRDAAQEEMRIAAWPADVRAKWDIDRRAYEAKKAEREQAAGGAEQG